MMGEARDKEQIEGQWRMICTARSRESAKFKDIASILFLITALGDYG